MRIWLGFLLPRSHFALSNNPFEKPARELDELAIKLASRGLVFENWAGAFEHLENIGYYRLTGYLHQFRVGGSGPAANDYLPNTTFEAIHDRYIFDRKLRLLVFEAVEKIEVTARVSISDSLARKHGPHWYMKQELFGAPNWFYSKDRKKFCVAQWHQAFLKDVKKQIGHGDRRRRNAFIKHYYDTYDFPELPPCWMTFEAVSFGAVSNCFKFLKSPEVRDTCKKFALNHQVLSSWLHSISYVRNMCAHHSRMWNHSLTIRPIVPAELRAKFDSGENGRIYAVLLAIQILLQRIWSNNHWAESLHALLSAHPHLPLDEIGFPANWTDREEWRLT